MSEIWWIVVLAGLLTYGTRCVGYLIVARLGSLPPRFEAALDAVPAAVLTTIVTPVLVSGDMPERIAIAGCFLLTFRLPLIATVAIGTIFVAVARALGF